ncbi:chemokine-like factor isoform X2 [Microcaecilia unicolor]|uniref:Chemokine-like factor isoform X2 n=1 Tax=Microcaecilia unicolor TaxID=1415580 RepID=A0A6P7Y0T9_9AMPH|nr:chemokine-like factor isoform X2 [Microcaecilia unicolor]
MALSYLKSPLGILKLLRMVFSLLACCCFLFASRNGMYVGVTGMEFFFTLCFMLLYLTELDKKITFFFWTLIDLLNTMLATVFVFIVSVVAIINMMNHATTVGGMSKKDLWDQEKQHKQIFGSSCLFS